MLLLVTCFPLSPAQSRLLETTLNSGLTPPTVGDQAARGKVNQNVEPCPIVLSTPTWPLWASTMALQM